MDPASVSVIGIVGETSTAQSPTLPLEKKAKKEKTTVKPKMSVASTSATDNKISELDLKWPECFNALEALTMAKSLLPTFSSDVRVTPSHSDPANVARNAEHFFQPASRPVDASALFSVHWPRLT